MEHLRIVASVIMMHKEVMAARVIDEDVAEILFHNGNRYYLHHAFIAGSSKFVISDEKNCFISSMIDGAEAVSIIVNLKKHQQLLVV